ncbi:chitin synthase chs-2-like [Babylonia areolata]|uniref:chitin synthase chs-2-like n=1 Tax=Babylonia areolata TaxID=304850 RepID=UPI003FCF1D86
MDRAAIVRGGRLQPNGPSSLGQDNPAFSTDSESKDTRQGLGDQPSSRSVEWDFKKRGSAESGEEEDDEEEEEGEEEDDDDYDSVKSQHHSRYTPHGSVGQESRLKDFEGELEPKEDKPWDVFEETPWENLAHADRQFWSRVNKVSRVIIILILFAVVLGGSSLSFFAFLLIVNNMNAASHNFSLPSGQLLHPAGDFVQVRWVWAAMMVTSAPYFFTLCACLQKLCVKRTRPLAWRPLLIALTVETFHSVGLGAFVFIVCPSYDPLMVVMLSYGVTFVPSAIQVYRVHRSEGFEETGFSWTFLVTALFSLAFPAVVVYRLYDDSIPLAIVTYFSLLFLSVEWWENFVAVTHKWKQERWAEVRYHQRLSRKKEYMGQKEAQSFRAGSWLFRLKYSIRDRRTKIEAVCSAWKMILTLVTPMVVFASRGGTDCMSALFYTRDLAQGCSLWRLGLASAGADWCSRYLPFLVAAVGILASGTAFKAAKVACKIHAQKLCFALPLLLSAPVTLAAVILTYSHRLELGGCRHLRWPVLKEGLEMDEMLSEYVVEKWLPLIVVGAVLLAVTTSHVWSSTAERVASTDKLFVRPLYCGVMFAQSVLLNRTMNDDDASLHLTTGSRSKEDWTSRYEKMTENLSADKIDEEMRRSVFPRIYACATMWHETAKETTQLLKSIFRMDRDQSVRAYMWKTMNVVDKDFYLFEGHIFFDDAFKKEETGSGEEYYVLNSWVRQFLDVVDEAARSIYPPNVELEPPTKTETPYGGRLTFTLPGMNPLIVHLKNKFLIRHKKRWSQVMYMYYLLSYKLLLGEHSGNKKRLADNTFLLALDGDVDFYPDSVQLLVDRMRRNRHVGAACGRIHPIGTGLMVWYQKFEYAVSHWLQKATEHVFGCVLCSPGCFSLFRASALMDDNVLRRYTKLATRARHAVQYDMGEDRWLCTLLLQQGWRVEYAAAADALTFCPDDFGEFFKQRRRWTPSTMANILDLLTHWRQITKVNSSVSLPFIAYQTFLFISSLLTPGTIFLLILGAINTAYPTLPLYGALVLNCLPLVLFLVLCFTASDNAQISYAAILSTLYSLVMMIVLVGLLRQVAESGMCSVTAIFFVGVAGIFCLAALLHPQEIWNLAYGLLYFLAIPCTSMLLIFYAVGNLNVVKWGTRDDSKPASDGGPAKTPQSRLQQIQGGLKRVVSMAGGAGGAAGGGAGGSVDGKDGGKTSDYNFSFGNLFRCICCPTKRENEEIMERFEAIENALHDLRRTIREESFDEEEWNPRPPPRSSSRLGTYQHSTPLPHDVLGDRETKNPLFRLHEEEGEGQGPGPGKNVLDSHLWIEDPKLGSGATDDLHDQEKRFWDQLIEKYLKPVDKIPGYKDKEEAIAKELTALRNKTSMMFFLSNALFVTVIFILETVAEYTPGLTIQLPCDTGHVGQKIEPISVTFTVIFGILLLLQLVGMVVHRYSTLIHIAAATTLHFRKPRVGSDEESFPQYGARDLYRFYMDIMWRSSGSPRKDEVSEVTSLTGQSISKDTIHGSGSVDRNVVSKIFQRQKSRHLTVRHQNLHNAMDERFVPMLDNIENAGRVAGIMEEVEKGETEEEGLETEMSEEGAEQTEEDQPEQDVEVGFRKDPIPQGLNWLGEHSRKVFVALAKDPKKLEIVRRRTQVNRDRWQNAFIRLRESQVTGISGEGNEGGRRPATGEETQLKHISDVVSLWMNQKQPTQQLVNRKEEENPEDPAQDGSKSPQVTFKTETGAQSGAGLQKLAAFSGHGSPSPPAPGTHRPRRSSKWRKVREANRLVQEQAGVSSPENVPLTTVVDVHNAHPSRSGAEPSPGSEGEVPDNEDHSSTQF